MKKKLALFLAIVLSISVLVLAGCGGGSGSGDVLKGTWVGTYEDGDATWTFDGKGNCTLTTMTLDKAPGDYVIVDDSQVDITLIIWSEAIAYTYKVDESSLTLTANNGYSPSYDLVKK